MKVTKGIIPAAGFGTRMLPATKSVAKEMLPIVDRPAIHYIVEEAVKSGITDILVIISRGKESIQDYFDHAPELEMALEKSGKKELLEEMQRIAGLANIQFIRQREMKGLGHAVLKAKSFVGQEPFAVLYGDDVIIGEDPACLQLIRAYEEHGLGVVGINQVPMEQVARYSSMKTQHIRDNQYTIDDMIEKPAPGQEFSNYSILGRCVLPPEIFTILENTPPGAGNEIQLTDAMKTLANQKNMIGVDFTGVRYDMGNKLGFLKANIEVGLKHPDISADFKAYLKGLTDSWTRE